MNQGTIVQRDLGSRFENLLGTAVVLTDTTDLQRYAIDSVVPRLVLQPESTEQIAAALRVCTEENWTVVPFGKGTRQHIGRMPDQVDVALSTEKLNHIESYDPGDLTISLQAGVSLAHAVAACAEHRQLLPIEAPEGTTIGGALSTSSAGPLRAAFGGLRDFCIGVNFISGDGMNGRGGGRVVKNVAGYDLMKLMIGSHGSLAIITSANFKLFPSPQQTITFVCEFASLGEGLALRDSLLRSPLSPLACEIVSPSAIEYLSESEPHDPDEWAPEPSTQNTAAWQLMIRFAGSDRVLARLRHELAASVSRELSGAGETDLWNQVGTFEERLLKHHRNAMIFQVELPLADSRSAIQAAESSATDYNFVAAITGRATVGSLIVAFLPLAIDPPAVTQFVSAASDFRSRLSKASSAVVMRCPREAKQHFDVWGSIPTDIELMQKVKRALDPQGILNRGRFLVA
ncbi:MAG TPA: FAD-binding oxidoreductase [Terriglobales bacterium]|nr:FAD-binding oxidoreductase [Terriglobales bacterium]